MTSFQKLLVLLFSAVWIWAAISPLSRYDWFLENILVFLFVPIIILGGRYFKLSGTSYGLLTLFLALHVFGSHYGYAEVPFGDTLGGWLGTTRNMFDRLMHLSFGLLLVYPIREAVRQITPVKGIWSYSLPLNVILSFSAVYEIMEWLTGLIVNPEVGVDFVGAQGDVWDPQKDMFLAGIGAFITLSLILAWNTLLSPAWRAEFRSKMGNIFTS